MTKQKTQNFDSKKVPKMGGKMNLKKFKKQKNARKSIYFEKVEKNSQTAQKKAKKSRMTKEPSTKWQKKQTKMKKENLKMCRVKLILRKCGNAKKKK